MRYVLGIWNKVVTQLETPREERPLGSGWLSGSLALLASLAGLLIVMLRWFPETFSYPEIAFIQDSGVVTVFLRFVLLSGYTLSLLSLILSARKSLGWTALALSVVHADIDSNLVWLWLCAGLHVVLTGFMEWSGGEHAINETAKHARCSPTGLLLSGF